MWLIHLRPMAPTQASSPALARSFQLIRISLLPSWMNLRAQGRVQGSMKVSLTRRRFPLSKASLVFWLRNCVISLKMSSLPLPALAMAPTAPVWCVENPLVRLALKRCLPPAGALVTLQGDLPPLLPVLMRGALGLSWPGGGGFRRQADTLAHLVHLDGGTFTGSFGTLSEDLSGGLGIS